jgi:hypothetical protein
MKNGFTLIELIVFIVVASIFIPFAYMAFSGVSRGAGTSERIVITRFLAEQKVEELTNQPFSQSIEHNFSWPSYEGTGYTNYFWKWNSTLIAYQDNDTHGITTLVDAATIPVRVARKSNTRYKLGDYVRPPTPNGRYYRLTDLINPNISQWEPSKNYNLGDYVVPSPPNGYAYRCIQAGISSSLSSSISWLTTPFAPVTDNTVIWEEHTTSADSADVVQPDWISGIGQYVSDGGIRWRESTVYKKIEVYVVDPFCNRDDRCAYTVNIIVSARPLGGPYL